MLIKFLKNVNLDGQNYTTASGEKSVTAEVGAALLASGSAAEVIDYTPGSGIGNVAMTVGAGGQYPTIAAALATKPLSDMFVPLTTMTSTPANALTWAKGSKEMFTSAAVIGNVLADGHYENLWVKLSGDTRLYPVQSVNGWGDAGTTGDSITLKVARIEASFSGTNALTFYRAVPAKIVLLDAEHDELVTIASPVCAEITSLTGTIWSQPTTETGGSTLLYAGEYGYLKLSGNISLAYGLAGNTVTPSAWVIELNRTKQSSQTSDFNSFEGAGLVILRDCEIHLSPIGGLGHFGLTKNNAGNLEIYGGTIHVHTNRSASTKGTSVPFDTCSVDRFIMDGTKIIIDDFSDNLTRLSVVCVLSAANTSLAGTVGPEIHMSNITVKSLYPSTATIVLVDENGNGSNEVQTSRTDKVSLVNCHVAKTNISGSVYLYRASTGGSGRVVQFQACSGGLVDTPSVGSRTGTALLT